MQNVFDLSVEISQKHYADSIDRYRQHLARLEEINRRGNRECLCIQIGSIIVSWAIAFGAVIFADWYWK